jgi:hypothetical protein
VYISHISVLHPIILGADAKNRSAIPTVGKANAKLIHFLLLQFGGASESLIPENLPIGNSNKKILQLSLQSNA